MLPLECIFFIGALAETNRAPFDLAEAESELVSGFMTEHAAVIFVFFFLAEYSSILLICILTSSLFLGGYLLNFYKFADSFIYTLQYMGVNKAINLQNNFSLFSKVSPFIIIEGLVSGLILGVKTCILVFTFI